MTCECGCGEEVSPGRRFRPGGHNSRARRAAWPTKAELEFLLEQHGSGVAVARALGCGEWNVRHMCRQLGVIYVPHVQGRASKIARGWTGEQHAALLLGGQLVRVADPRANPFDVLVGDLRLEVKTSRPSTSSLKRDQVGWSFNVGHNRGKNDAYFLICCADNGLPIAYLLIPSHDATVTTIRFPVTMRGKWAPFLWRPSSLTSV